MDVNERLSGEVAILELGGRLTVNDQPGVLKEAVAGALQRGARHVCSICPASATSTARGWASSSPRTSASAASGGRLKLVATPDRIVELLSLAGLSGIFERYATDRRSAGKPV